jgi:hypothetical protein
MKTPQDQHEFNMYVMLSVVVVVLAGIGAYLLGSWMYPA